MNLQARVVLCLLLSVTPALPPADEAHLASGDRLIGEIQSVDSDFVTITTPYAEDNELPRADVVALLTDDPVTVLFNDGSYLTGRFVAAAPPALRLEHQRTGAVMPCPLSDVESVYRGDPMEAAAAKERVELAGIANVGLDRRRGNSDTDNYHLDLERRWAT